MIIAILFISVIVGIPLFFLPTVIARNNNHPQFGPIFFTTAGSLFVAALLKSLALFVFPSVVESGVTTPDVVGEMLTWSSIIALVVGWMVAMGWSLFKKV